MHRFEDQPPYSNRGVLNTSQSTLRAVVDWVQVTFTSVYSVQKVYSILGMNETDFSDSPISLYGYKTHKKNGNISVLYDGSAGMGVHVQMSGQGCREYETFGKKNWVDFIADCFANEGKFSRVDVALDDIRYNGDKPYFTINKLYRKVKDGCVKSKFRRGKLVESFSVNDGEGLGETLYFGREQSDIQFRFYEKDFERQEAGKELEENLTAWNRIEVQCRRVRAELLARHIMNDDSIGEVCTGILKNYISFLIKNPEESNRARWKTCDWWNDFLGDSEKIRLTMVAPDKTIERARKWIDKQVLPSLGMLFMASGSDINMIGDMLNEGMERLTDSQIQLAEEFIEQAKIAKEHREYLKNEQYQKMMFKTVNTYEDKKEGRKEAIESELRKIDEYVDEVKKTVAMHVRFVESTSLDEKKSPVLGTSD